MSALAQLRGSPNRHRLRWIPVLVASAVLTNCADHPKTAEAPSPACVELAKTVAGQEQAFVNRVKAIREQHILLQEYDRLMIEALTDRRAALQSTTLTEMKVTTSIDGCSGQGLEDLRRKAQQQVLDLRIFLRTFQRAVKYDPPDVFIDTP